MKTKNLKTEWDLSLLAKADDDPELKAASERSRSLVQAFAKKWQPVTTYLSDPDALNQALEEYQLLLATEGLNGRAGYYFQLRTSLDETDPTLKGLQTQTDQLQTELQNQIQFFTLNLASVSPDQQRQFLAAPVLQPYRHFLYRLFQEQQYLLSEPEEKLLNLVSQPGYAAWVRMTSSFLAQESAEVLNDQGQTETKNISEIMSLINHRDKRIRDTAAQALDVITAKHAPVAAEELNAIIGYKKIQDEIRRVPRPDSLRHLSDDIDSEVVDAMIEAVSSRFEIAKRYYQLKAKLFKVPQLAYHERNIDYGQLNQQYTFDQALELVAKVMAQLDPQFADILAQFVHQGQIDVYPKSGKSGGAFCAHHLISQPTYILLNFTNRLQDVLTLAHELGHGINNELMRQHQSALNFDSPLSTAEVASTFMEDFVLEELGRQANPDTQLALNMMKLNDDISSIFRQVAAYQFEQQLHKQIRDKGYLSSHQIGELFSEHMQHYMGSAVEQSSGSQNWWVYWSHLRNFFYVYSYASGLLISKALQHQVRSQPTTIEGVKQFLSAGTSASPKEIFVAIGIDIAQPHFWRNGLQEVESLLDQTEQLAHQLQVID